ncbi:MAG: protein-disulfide reductase DsbD domain-containing protein [Gammaproteobacteria bacterium]|tara:strand:- start:487 stop:903 length:417 start_codon:yes stop_codon:yes gene_type:complete
MKKIFFIFIIVVHSFEMLGGNNFIFPENDNEVVPAKEAFSLDIIKENDAITATWNIKEDCYIYLDSVSVAKEGSKIKFKRLEGDSLDYRDEFFGETKIIKDILKISFEYSPEDKGIKISYQGCSEKGFCYPVQVLSIN